MLNRKTLVVLIFAVCVIFSTGQLHASRVLWDVSHGPIGDNNLAGNYNTLSRMLQQNEFLISEGNSQHLSRNIWSADILVISILSNYDEEYSEDEINRILSFVESGGGLIVLSDNSQMRPDNIEALLGEFDFLAARNNFISDLIEFEVHALTEGIGSISIRGGGEIVSLNQEEIQPLGWDQGGFMGFGLNESRGGPVILVCDADVWHNDMLENEGNAQLALNCLNYATRNSTGRITGDFNDLESHLMAGDQQEFSLSLVNEGEGVLEIGLEFADDEDVDWLTFEPNYAMVESNQEFDFNLIVDASGQQPGSSETTEVVIYHSDPTNEFFQFQISITVLPEEPTYFESVEPTGNDHSLLIQELTIDGAPPRWGIEVGIFTSDNICTGAYRYSGVAFGMAARGDDPITDEIEGFVTGERISYKFYIPWEDREIGATPAYIQGGGDFRTDGLSILNLYGNPYGSQVLSLRNRWNLISLNVQPNNLDFETMFQPLLDENMLLMVKDGRGHFWDVDNGFNNLGDWSLTQGYEICVAHPTELELDGIEVQTDLPIPVNAGWSLIPYLPRRQMNVSAALNSIEDDLVFAKQTNGAFYAPEWDWDGIGNLIPGKGYKISMVGAGTLIYSNDNGDDMVNMIAHNTSSFTPSPTGIDMSLLLNNFKPGALVRVITASSIEVGTGIAGDDGRVGLCVFGDDPSTPMIEGLSSGDAFFVQVQQSGDWINQPLEWLKGDNSYSTDGFAVGRLINESSLPNDFNVSCFPNPFNDRFSLNISGGSGKASVRIYDTSGRILQKWDGKLSDSQTSLKFSGQEMPAGVIFIDVQTQENTRRIKAVYLP